MVAAAFASDVGVDNDALQLPNGGYLWYDVTGITPSRERTLDEVKDQVAARWRDDEIAKRLQAKADDMLGKLKAGTALAQLATEAGLKVETATDLQRGKPAGFVPAKVVDAVFKTRQGRAGSAEGDNADRALRVPRHRRRSIPTLDPTRRKPSSSRPRCRIPTPTTSSANISRGSKTISASRSTSRR